jgi:large subunit ribosomal protein L5
MNKMKQVIIEKVTVNMGVGETGEELETAIKILETISGMKPTKTKCKIKQPGWGIREGLTIGTKVTLRKEKANQFLEKALKAKDNKLREKNFDKTGNFGFGIKEYIDLPGTKYDPQLGIKGFDVLVTLKKPGYRIKRRKIGKTKIPLKHRVTKNDAIEFVKTKFGVEVI